MSSEGGRENIGSNKFGSEWEEQQLPVVGIVGAIDEVGDDAANSRLGLSAMQLRNLAIERKGHASGMRDLVRAVMRNTEGLTDDTEYPTVFVRHGGKEIEVNVYNAFGKLSLKAAELEFQKKPQRS